MLKTIGGRGYMTGTSEGSLYPVVLKHKNGVHIGARLELQQGPKPELILVAIYARIEMYDSPTMPGEDLVLVPMTLPELFEAVPHMFLRIASPTHMSGSLGGGMFQVDPDTSQKEKAEVFGKLFRDSVVKLGEKLGLTAASDADLLFFGSEAFLTKIAGHVDDAKVEAQITDGSMPFDLGSLKDKFGPLPKPE